MFAKFTLLIATLLALISPGLAPAAEWQKLNMIDYRGHLLFASSELNAVKKPEPGRYSIVNLFDQRLDSCWAEGVSGDGRGSDLIFDLPPGIKTIAIASGYQKSSRLFLANNRPASFTISILVAINQPGAVTETHVLLHASQFPWHATVTMQDSLGFQQIPITPDWQALSIFKDQQVQKFRQLHKTKSPLNIHYLVKLTLKKTFSGTKYDDTCLSEIRYINATEKIVKIYLNTKEDSILLDTTSHKGLIMAHVPGAVFQIITSSPDNNWLVAIRMDSAPSPRTETIYELYNTGFRQKIKQSLLGEEVGDMYDFDIKNGSTYISFLNKKSQDIEELNLTPILRELEQLSK